MKVQLKVQISGSRNGEDWPAPGEVVDLPDEEAAVLLATGVAEPVQSGKVESAAAKTQPKA